MTRAQGRPDDTLQFVRGWQARLAACIVATFFGAFGYGCSEDDEGGEHPIACCRIQMLCDNCSCPNNLEQIGESGHEGACEAALEDDDLGCGDYGENDAILDCVSPMGGASTGASTG